MKRSSPHVFCQLSLEHSPSYCQPSIPPQLMIVSMSATQTDANEQTTPRGGRLSLKKPKKDARNPLDDAVGKMVSQINDSTHTGAVTNMPQEGEPESKKRRMDVEEGQRKRKRPDSTALSESVSPPQVPSQQRAHQDNSISNAQKEDGNDEDDDANRPRNVDKVFYGKSMLEAWYYAPLPAEFGEFVERLYVCDRCLKYMHDQRQMAHHKMRCRSTKFPGRLIYEKEEIKIFEVDGRDHKLFCQNLCLISKMFLETKTLYYDVEGFVFYILAEKDGGRDRMVGFFSKEKLSYDNYNLACIMVLPTHQRKGYGRLLIELSYEISKHEHKIGSPERPLSALGAAGYRSFWAAAITNDIKAHPDQLRVRDISLRTAIHPDDVLSTLEWLGLLRYWKMGSGSPPARYAYFSPAMLDAAVQSHRLKLDKRIDPSHIRWE